MKKDTVRVKVNGLSISLDKKMFKDKEIKKRVDVVEDRIKEIEKALKRVGIVLY